MNNRVFTFMLLALNAFVTIFLAGYSTKLAVWFYTIKFVIAMTYRYIDYKKISWHYFMTEFCYFANSMFVLYIIAHQLFDFHSPIIFHMLFVVANGPLPLGAITLGDKLVFHDVQKIISLMLHVSPAILSWSIRWHNPELFSDAHTNIPDFTISKVLTDTICGTCLATIPYVIWAIVYYLFVFCYKWKSIHENKFMTVYTYFGNQETHILNKVIGQMKEGHLKHIIYMFLHFSTVLPTYLLSGLWWNSYYLHTSLIVFLSIVAIYYAATYYDKKLLKND